MFRMCIRERETLIIAIFSNLPWKWTSGLSQTVRSQSPTKGACIDQDLEFPADAKAFKYVNRYDRQAIGLR